MKYYRSPYHSPGTDVIFGQLLEYFPRDGRTIEEATEAVISTGVFRPPRSAQFNTREQKERFVRDYILTMVRKNLLLPIENTTRAAC